MLAMVGDPLHDALLAGPLPSYGRVVTLEMQSARV